MTKKKVFFTQHPSLSFSNDPPGPLCLALTKDQDHRPSGPIGRGQREARPRARLPRTLVQQLSLDREGLPLDVALKAGRGQRQLVSEWIGVHRNVPRMNLSSFTSLYKFVIQ